VPYYQFLYYTTIVYLFCCYILEGPINCRLMSHIQYAAILTDSGEAITTWIIYTLHQKVRAKQKANCPENNMDNTNKIP